MRKEIKAAILLGVIGLCGVIVGAWVISEVRGSKGPPIRVPGPDGSGRAGPAFDAAPAAPEPQGPRIVILSPALAVTARDMGLEKFIVGRHAYDVALDPELPVCGDQSGIDYEALLAARPTRVWVEWGARPLPARLTDLARENGWSLTSVNALSIGDVRDIARAMHEGVVVPLEKRGLLPEGVDEHALEGLERAATRRFAAPPVGRVLLLGATDPPSAFGPGSLHYELLQAMGAQPAVAGGSAYITLDAEDVLRMAPDAIVIIEPRTPEAAPGARDAASLRERLGRVGTLEIPAVKNGKLGLIDDPLCHMPSTASARLADELAGVLRRMAGE